MGLIVFVTVVLVIVSLIRWSNK